MKHLFVTLICLFGISISNSVVWAQKNDRNFLQLKGNVSSVKVTRTIPPTVKNEDFNDIYGGSWKSKATHIYNFHQDGSFTSIDDFVFISKGDKVVVSPRTKPTEHYAHYSIITYDTNITEDEFIHSGRFSQFNGKGGNAGEGEISVTLSFDQFGRVAGNEYSEPLDALWIGECRGNRCKCIYTYRGQNTLPSSVEVQWSMGGEMGVDNFNIFYGKLDTQNNWLNRTLLFKETGKVAFTEQRTITYY